MQMMLARCGCLKCGGHTLYPSNSSFRLASSLPNSCPR